MATNQTTLAAAGDIRDIKPPIEIPTGWEWLWLPAMLVTLAALFLLWHWWQKRRAQVALVPPVPAHVRAKQKLEEALALISQPKPFVIAVSDATRTYLEERFQFRAPERTTEEFLRELGGTDLLAGDQKESLGGFLESCDLVKFAKYEPGENELRELHSSAVRLVEETIPMPSPETIVSQATQKHSRINSSSQGNKVVDDALKSAEWIANALKGSGYVADFSPESLWEIDRFFEEHTVSGKPKPHGLLAADLGQRLFALGAYIGEVVRRSQGGAWVGNDSDSEAEINIELHLPGGIKCWPVQRVIKRLSNGAEDGIAGWGVGAGLNIGKRKDKA